LSPYTLTEREKEAIIVDFDWGSLSSTILAWIFDHILSYVILEALGLAAILTTALGWITGKLSRWRDKIVFVSLLTLGFMIAINSFGYREPRPQLNFVIYRVATTDSSNRPSDTIVIAYANITNRGDAPTKIVGWAATAFLNGRSNQAIPLKSPTPIKTTTVGKEETLSLDDQLMSNNRMLQIGEPLEGWMMFAFKDTPISDFSSMVKYTFSITDSFGNIYKRDIISHGELMKIPEYP
jgi:hypothetical protein